MFEIITAPVFIDNDTMILMGPSVCVSGEWPIHYIGVVPAGSVVVCSWDDCYQLLDSSGYLMSMGEIYRKELNDFVVDCRATKKCREAHVVLFSRVLDIRHLQIDLHAISRGGAGSLGIPGHRRATSRLPFLTDLNWESVIAGWVQHPNTRSHCFNAGI
jgi:hypothetical protein